jgi:hypothetical protein
LKHPNTKLARNHQSPRLVQFCVWSLVGVFAACSSEDDGGEITPVPFTPPGSAPSSSGVGGASAVPSGMAGGTATGAAAPPTSEQPAAGNGTPIASSAGAGGSAMTNGSGGSSMAAAAGSGMVPAASAGAGGQPSVPALTPCENGALFCENFDGLALGALPVGFNGMQPERAVSVITDPARGQVLQVQSGATYGNKAGIFLNDFAPPNNSYFGRIFVNVAAFPVADADHWVIVEATGATGDQVRPVGGQFQRWAPGADGLSAGDWTDWQQSNAATVAGAWSCVEWQMNGANGGNDILLWVDGVQVQPMDRPAFAFPTINRLWIGWVVYQMGEPIQYDVRIDDIVLSTERIGCN